MHKAKVKAEKKAKAEKKRKAEEAAKKAKEEEIAKKRKAVEGKVVILDDGDLGIVSDVSKDDFNLVNLKGEKYRNAVSARNLDNVMVLAENAKEYASKVRKGELNLKKIKKALKEKLAKEKEELEKKRAAVEAAKTYDVTKVDILNHGLRIKANQITVRGINKNTPLEKIYQKFNKSSMNLKKAGNYVFLDLEPGLRLRLTQFHDVNAIVINKKFKKNLVGHTAILFDKIGTENRFKSYLTDHFGKPDSYKSKQFSGGAGMNKALYFKQNDQQFMRLYGPSTSDLLWMIGDVDYD
jgi:hypothetical protein